MYLIKVWLSLKNGVFNFRRIVVILYWSKSSIQPLQFSMLTIKFECRICFIVQFYEAYDISVIVWLCRPTERFVFLDYRLSRFYWLYCLLFEFLRQEESSWIYIWIVYFRVENLLFCSISSTKLYFYFSWLCSYHNNWFLWKKKYMHF